MIAVARSEHGRLDDLLTHHQAVVATADRKEESA
jgi:hypothetical protein